MQERKRETATQHAECTGKHRFDSAALAMTTARKSSRRKDARTSAYHCVFCGGWHIGSRIVKKKG